MDPRKLVTEFGLDERLGHACAYCGGQPDTVDHAPSKVLLDDPLPSNLPVVPACTTCNHGFSLDEEYLACFLGCVTVGAVQSDLLRPKVRAALGHNPKLQQLIAQSAARDAEGRVHWAPDRLRVGNVVVKLARAHALYEQSVSQLEEPSVVEFVPVASMNVEQRRAFEQAGTGDVRAWPEIGSRAFLRATGANPFSGRPGPWIDVQPNRYRYSVDEGSVQLMLSEYLACTVRWD